MIKTVADSKQVDIQVGDWVDVLPNVLDNDPEFGRSFQVTEMPENEDYLMIRALVPGTQNYADTGLSYENIEANYRQVPFEE